LEAETFLASHSISDYLKKVEERLQEEGDRVEHSLNGHTRQPLISECEHVLIRERLPLMVDAVPGLLESDREEDLQRIYSLLSRIPESLELLQKKFEEHVKQTGRAGISKLFGEAGSTAGPLDSRLCVDTLHDIHQKNSEIVMRNFGGGAGFIGSLDRACREVVDKNTATGECNSKSRDLIVKYADLLLNEADKRAEVGDLERALNRVVCCRVPSPPSLLFILPSN